MMDWRTIGNGLWILGLSSLLATFGYYDWLARVSRQSRAAVFRSPSFRLFRNSGLFLVTIGWAIAQAGRWWEKGLLFVVASWVLWEVGSAALSVGGTHRNTASDDVAAD